MFEKVLSKEEYELIHAIAVKASKRYEIDLFTVEMDITAVHSEIPLRLKDLLVEDVNSYDFVHDIWGIRTNLNRSTGKIENCFVPRFAKEG